MKATSLLAAGLASVLSVTLSSAAPTSGVNLHVRAGPAHLIRRQVDAAGVDFKNDVKNHQQQNNFENQVDHTKQQDVTQKDSVVDVSADCFMTYENWNAFVDWDEKQSAVKNQNGDKFDFNGQNKQLDGQKNIGANINQQHCVLTVNELETFQRTTEDRKQHDRTIGNNKDVKHQKNDQGTISTEQITLQRFCVVFFNENWQKAENDLKIPQDTTKKLRDYANTKGRDHYKGQFNTNGNFGNNDQKKGEEQTLQANCMVFQFQIDMFSQWNNNWGFDTKKADLLGFKG